jgi:hypothetical protein
VSIGERMQNLPAFLGLSVAALIGLGLFSLGRFVDFDQPRRNGPPRTFTTPRATRCTRRRLSFSMRWEAALRTLRYPLGERVTVCYNPSDPSIASILLRLNNTKRWWWSAD